MSKKNDCEIILRIVELVALAIIAAVTVYTMVMFINNFGYTPELGIYDTRVYHFTLGDYIKYGEEAFKYDYTNLNFIEIITRIW